MGRGIHPQIPHLQQSGSSRRGSPAQNRPDAGHHLHHAEGLGEVIVSPQIQPHHLVILRPTGGSNDDRDAGGGGIAPEGFENFDTVHPGQHNIQQGQVKVVLGNQVRRGAAIVGNRAVIPRAAQADRNQPGNGNFVLHNQNAVHPMPPIVIYLKYSTELSPSCIEVRREELGVRSWAAG